MKISTKVTVNSNKLHVKHLTTDPNIIYKLRNAVCFKNWKCMKEEEAAFNEDDFTSLGRISIH